MQNISGKDEFDLHGNEPLGKHIFKWMDLETASAYSWTFIEGEYEPFMTIRNDCDIDITKFLLKKVQKEEVQW